MGACVCCFRRGNYHGCACSPEGGCRVCGLCLTHCLCLMRAIEQVTARFGCTDPDGGLDELWALDAPGPPPGPGGTVGG